MGAHRIFEAEAGDGQYKREYEYILAICCKTVVEQQAGYGKFQIHIYQS